MLSLSAAFRTDLAGHARHLGSEGAELIHHGVDGVLELEDLALHVDGDLLREIAVGDCGGDGGDVADLAGEVTSHRVDGVRQVFPGAGDALHLGLAAELAFRTDLTRDAGHLGGERSELIDHGVDGLGGAQELALQRPSADLQGHGLREIALGHGADHAGGLARGVNEIADEGIDRGDGVGPGAADLADRGALGYFALFADDAAQALELLGESVVELDDVIEGVGDLAVDAEVVARQPHRELAPSERRERHQELASVERFALGARRIQGLRGRARRLGARGARRVP